MIRSLLFFSLSAAWAAAAVDVSADPAFRDIPFDQWLAHSGETRIKWQAHVSRPRLSEHQRMLIEIEAQVDGVEFEKRLGKGSFQLLVQITDGGGNRYQNHIDLELEKRQEGIRNQVVTATMTAFLLPGDYRAATALFNTATGEHSAREEKLRVDALRDDPLHDAWRDLPAVEFVKHEDPPDSWYLPEVDGRLRLPVRTKRPIQLDVIVNLTPSERLSGSSRAQDRNLGRLIPALKAMSQIELSNGAINVDLLDLTRQRVAFHQENARALDWEAMKAGLEDTKPGVIDIKSLEHRGHSARFFVQQVERKVNACDESQRRIVIVLSSPVEFERGEELHPIAPPETRACQIVYVRYRAPISARMAMARAFPPDASRRGPSWGGPAGPGNGAPPPVRGPQIDQLEPTLKPLQPRLFDVSTPEEFRKALAAILRQLE